MACMRVSPSWPACCWTQQEAWILSAVSATHRRLHAASCQYPVFPADLLWFWTEERFCSCFYSFSLTQFIPTQPSSAACLCRSVVRRVQLWRTSITSADPQYKPHSISLLEILQQKTCSQLPMCHVEQDHPERLSQVLDQWLVQWLNHLGFPRL